MGARLSGARCFIELYNIEINKYKNRFAKRGLVVKNEQEKKFFTNNLKKGDLILTGAYGFPVPINDKKLIEVTSSAFGDVKATFY